MNKTPQEHLETLTEIRDLMQRSTRFLSLSGLSGVFAGIFALIGAGVAYWYLGMHFSVREYYQYAFDGNTMRIDFVLFFWLDASAVLALSIGVGYYFSWRKAKRYQLKMWDKSTYSMIESLFVPLIAGGVFCIILLLHHQAGLIAPCTLIFYGLGLINASKYTLREIYYLGLLEIVLGLIAAYFLHYGLLFWAIGFGFLHIIYGLLMYYRYERTRL